MENLIAFLSIVTSILGIAIFVKIWLMTNNVASLKKKLVDNDVKTDDYAAEREMIKNVRKALLKKDQQKAHDIVLDYVVCDLYYRIRNKNERGKISNLLIVYTLLFAKIGEPLPDNIASLKDFEDVRSLFTWPSETEVGEGYDTNDPNAYFNYWISQY